MDTDIFRKVALDRLSSPEQLDLILRVTGPRNWLALTGLFAVLTVGVVWGYTGTIATKATGQGVIVRSGTVLNVVSIGAGLVTSINAKLGDRVKANQLVARVSQPEMLEKIRLARAALDEARGIRERNLRLRAQGAQLQVDAIVRDKANAQREILELQDQAKLTTEQIAVDDQLLTKGLIAKQQTLVNRQKLININGQIESLKAKIKQIDSEEYTAKTQPVQSDEEMRARITDLERNVAGLERQMEISSSVISPYAGEVIEMKAVPGGLVTTGAPILSIQPEEKALEVLVYLPSEKVKAVRPGMEAQVSPSMIKREEFGFIRSHVVYVGQFPASTDALMRNFENQTLVQSIAASGPVTELRVAMQRDPGTTSGFKWSSPKGPAITLTSGTLCSVLVVTREQTPISLLFPFMKSKLGLD